MKQRNFIDISDMISKPTPLSVKETIVKKVVARRKEMGLSQKELANKSGVSYGSIKRFELLGEISFSSLVEIANALNKLSDFDYLFDKPAINDLSKDFK